MSLPTIHNLTPLSLKGLCEGAEFASFSLFPSPEPDEDKHSASCHAEPPCIVRQTYRGNRNENESLGHSRQVFWVLSSPCLLQRHSGRYPIPSSTCRTPLATRRFSHLAWCREGPRLQRLALRWQASRRVPLTGTH